MSAGTETTAERKGYYTGFYRARSEAAAIVCQYCADDNYAKAFNNEQDRVVHRIFLTHGLASDHACTAAKINALKPENPNAK